ncbi:MAG: RND transporter, partial [Polaromonas sp.]|nr:RND transporter [Polaromonas sp.]
MPVVSDPANFDRKSGSRLEQLVFNNRLPVLLLCLFATVVLGYFALKLQVNASFERMIPSSSPYVQNYFAYRKELPGLGNTVRIVVENKKGDVYDAAHLEKLRKINDTLYLIPGVDRSWMKSLWMPIVRWRQVTEEGVVGG